MKLARLLSVSLLVCTFLMTPALAADKDSPAQTKCPVMGGTINKDIYADYEGKRVYFCCEACISTFKKDPAKYVKKLEEEGVALETVSAGGHDHDHDHDHDKPSPDSK
jgi:YHS domain-containing protein